MGLWSTSSNTFGTPVDGCHFEIASVLLGLFGHHSIRMQDGMKNERMHLDAISKRKRQCLSLGED